MMPLPKPKEEDREEFMQRCMSTPRMETEYPTRIQRLAVCAVLWVRR
jgi:hypothetical protein